ncbi:hypothetical protein [Kitasatospora terrestris]|uniref:Uncharacterized protein n=1 Tax=Kitasatospora terrestris TaxID=258051 RepID=A0ABP9DFK3_9ACTN
MGPASAVKSLEWLAEQCWTVEFSANPSYLSEMAEVFEKNGLRTHPDGAKLVVRGTHDAMTTTYQELNERSGGWFEVSPQIDS